MSIIQNFPFFTIILCLLCAVVTGILLGGGAALAGRQLLHFYSSDGAAG